MRGHTRHTTSDPLSGETTTRIGWSALLPWAGPGIGALLLLPIGAIIHGLWGSGAAPWVSSLTSVLLVMITIGLAVLAHIVTKAMWKVIHVAAIPTAILIGVWLLVVHLFGINKVTVSLWAPLAVVIAIAFPLIKWGRTHRGGETSDAFSEAINQPGARIVKADRKGGMVSTIVEARKGSPVEDLAKKTREVASYAGVPVDQVRSTVLPGEGRKVRFDVHTVDLLATPVPYPGPSNVGGSIMDPLVLGVREDGSPLQIFLPGDERAGRAGTHVGVSGMTGAGKTVFARVLGTEVLTRWDAELDIVDPIKGAQLVGPFRGRARRIATDIPSGLKVFNDMLNEDIPFRTEHLGARDLEEWVPGCGIPARVVIVDEVPLFLGRDKGRLSQNIKLLRSTGIFLVLIGQKWTHTNIPTDVRSQCGTFLAFGCRNGDEAFGLSKEAVQSGAAPNQWRADHPGKVYLEASTVRADEWSMPGRIFHAKAVGIRQTLDLHCPLEPDEVETSEPQAEAYTVAPLPHSPAPPPSAPALTLVPPAPITASEMFRDHLNDLVKAGTKRVKPADFEVIKERFDLSPAWVSNELAKLVTEGILIKTGARGVYEVVGGEVA